MRIALAQLNLPVGDIDGNVERIAQAIAEGRERGAEVVALPELSVTGYPPEDLLHKRSFVRANREAIDELVGRTRGVIAVVGFVDGEVGHLYNAAALLHDGDLLGIYHKHQLPNYGVFDEQRYFRPGRGHLLLDTGIGILGTCICEDAWFADGPVRHQGDAGAQVVVNINASPYHKGKHGERSEMLCERARGGRTSVVYVNAVGGQDELVFDGGSIVVSPNGEVVARLPQFEETIEIVDVPLGVADGVKGSGVKLIEVDLRPAGERELQAPPNVEDLEAAGEIYGALMLALRDYVTKNGFSKVVIGLSGGIDSALTAAIAADALGSDNVLVVAMPSEYSSSHSVEDAKALAANLDLELLEIPIAAPWHAYLDILEGAFGKPEHGVAEENLQARIRGNLLMAISNRYGHLVVATGNKSEMACGYATLYGDMAGGFALLKDVFKTEVYELARWRNSRGEAIPENTISKPPSAELRPEQKDSDSLPPYDVLDPILEGYIEDDLGLAELVERGYDASTVMRVIRMVDLAEYKRRQAPPGPKVTTKAFGRDRRLPITNAWREPSAEGDGG